MKLALRFLAVLSTLGALACIGLTTIIISNWRLNIRELVGPVLKPVGFISLPAVFIYVIGTRAFPGNYYVKSLARTVPKWLGAIYLLWGVGVAIEFLRPTFSVPTKGPLDSSPGFLTIAIQGVTLIYLASSVVYVHGARYMCNILKDYKGWLFR
jgi:hypothetical protein